MKAEISSFVECKLKPLKSISPTVGLKKPSSEVRQQISATEDTFLP